MAAEQIPLIEVAPVPVEHKPPRADMYLVFAYCRATGWSCRREKAMDEHPTLLAARVHAQKLSAQWTDRCIAHIQLGGD